MKFETEFNYSISTLDHQSEEGEKSNNIFITTHPEIKRPKGLKAEGGENQVVLTWKEAENSIKYFVYQNGVLVDSTNSLTSSVTTEAGSENCFSISGVDQYGSIGPRSDAACDKSVFSAPDTVLTSNDKRNNNSISWNLVEGATTYNLYRDNKILINTSKLEFVDKLLKWDTEYTYHLTSLTDEGSEGPKSIDYIQKTPPIYIVNGVLIDENGEKDNVDQAKVFLYDSLGTTLLEEFVVSRNGKFKFENEIISGDYTIMAYGNGSGNGGGRVKVINQDINDLKIDLSTEGLRPTIKVERGVGELTVHWTDIPQAKSYNVYKNDRLIQSVTGDTSYLDIVAPGIEMTYKVMSVDIYDLEGPESNKVTEKSEVARLIRVLTLGNGRLVAASGSVRVIIAEGGETSRIKSLLRQIIEYLRLSFARFGSLLGLTGSSTVDMRGWVLRRGALLTDLSLLVLLQRGRLDSVSGNFVLAVLGVEDVDLVLQLQILGLLGPNRLLRLRQLAPLGANDLRKLDKLQLCR